MTVKELVLAHGKPVIGSQDFTLTETADAVYVYFRASTTFMDWVRDFLCWTVKAFGGRIHYGCWQEFMDAYENKSLMAPINKAQWTGKPIKLFGYSKGAGIAAIMWVHLTRQRCNVSAILAGCPPIFFWRAATPSLQNDRVKFVRYGNDIVCWLPPWFKRMPVSYRAASVNTGIFKCIKDHGSYVDCNEELPAAWFE